MIEEKEIRKNDKQINKKKKFLRQFYWDSKDLKDLEKKLEDITLTINKLRTSNINTMPKGGVSKDILDLIGQQEEYQQQIMKKIFELEKNKQNIELSLYTLEDSRLRLILRYVYLNNLTYKEIAMKLRKSERHIRRLHDLAIRLIEIVKK